MISGLTKFMRSFSFTWCRTDFPAPLENYSITVAIQSQRKHRAHKSLPPHSFSANEVQRIRGKCLSCDQPQAFFVSGSLGLSC